MIGTILNTMLTFVGLVAWLIIFAVAWIAFTAVANASPHETEMGAYKSYTFPNHSVIGQPEPIVLAQVANEAPCIGLECNIEVPTINNPANDANFVGGIEPDTGSFEIYPDSGLMNQFPTHIECEQNYYHANLSVFQLGQALGMCMGPAAPVCDVESDMPDGGGGRLWKPESDNTNRPVILFPSNYESNLEIELLGQAGFIENLTFRTRANGNRPHFDVRQSCGGYSSSAPLVLRVLRDSGARECYSIPNPCQRYD